MSSIHDALKRVQHDEAKILPVLNTSRPWSSPRNWAIIIIAVTLSSVMSMGMFYFMTRQDKLPEPVKVSLKTEQVPVVKAPAQQSKEPQINSEVSSSLPQHNADTIKAPDKSKDEYIKLADLYYSKGDYEKAISTYAEALGIYNNDAGLLNNLGAVMLAKNDYDGAIKYFKVAINCSKDKVEPVYNLACAYALKGKSTLALKELNKALKMDGDEVRKWAENDPDLEIIKGKWK
jgi:tetratricopeptide (TPR) repeat protein